MSSALSPTSVATNKVDGPVSSKDFAEFVRYYQQTHKAIVKMTAIVNKLPGNQPMVIDLGNGKTQEIRRSDVKSYSAAYVAQLGDLKKLFSAKKKRVSRPNAQLNSLFYVSDQLVAFYNKANLGPADPEDPSGDKLNAHIDILVKNRMSTSGILTSLISRYIEANKLKTSDSSGRFQPDERMKKAFSTTRYLLQKEDLSKRKLPRDLDETKATKIKESIKVGKESAFSRVSGRKDNRSGEDVYDENTGLLYTTMMVFNNFYRIPPALLTDEERDALKEEENVEMARELQGRLSKITLHKKKTKV